MNSHSLYLLVIFTFLLPISLACDDEYTPMNGTCTRCESYVPGCWSCFGDANYCTRCYPKALIRGKCQCDDIGCEKCHDDSSECHGCKDGFNPEPSPEGDCLPCPANCPYCGHKTWQGYEVCYKCEDPGEGYNRSTCTPCPKNCRYCGMSDSPIKEFECESCEDGYTKTPTRECTVCLIDNCKRCQFESLDKCTYCIHGMYLHEGKCVTNPPNCEKVKSDSDPVECETCKDYFYQTPDKLCKPIPQEGCKRWDEINLKCIEGCGFWDYNEGACNYCYKNYFALTTYANIISHKYERCNLTCNTVTYTDSSDDYDQSFCLTENKCPSGYYLNKYRNCVPCGGDLCTDCTDEGCKISAHGDLIELFADDWKGKGKSFGVAIEETDCDHGQYIYNEMYCFKDHCPNGMEVKGNNTCEGGSPAAYGVTFSLIFIFLILIIQYIYIYIII